MTKKQKLDNWEDKINHDNDCPCDSSDDKDCWRVQKIVLIKKLLEATATRTRQEDIKVLEQMKSACDGDVGFAAEIWRDTFNEAIQKLNSLNK